MCCKIKGNNKKINMKKEKMCEPLKSRNIVNYLIIIFLGLLLTIDNFKAK